MAKAKRGAAGKPAVVQSHIALPGSQRELLPDSRLAGSIDPTEVSSLTIRTRPQGDLGAIEAELAAQYARPLGRRQYLSRGDAAEKFGARIDDLDALEAFA